ncbi:TonB-dependent receptor plug domain-containing protein [Sinimarinibacterium sp. CAU 1509]|uniref:TonB-dependent receptor plug domain-containing protein n=1 Tax=Sinimarinibacterium sp. CAU 1509 TaxID=2562283 RepID=UPI00146EF19B|nr:TonB-dependent receptor [Sinimarinibacterium sp. CAU 1509]
MEISSKRKRSGDVFLRTAIAAVVASSFSSGAVFAQEEAKEGDSAKLDTIEVTGSRLTRANVEGALPVSVIDRADIEASGFTSVGELLRNTVFNSAGAFRAQSGSSAQSLVAVDLRGLGSERTLVLIDGRRAPKAPFAPTAQDLNAVPIAAVERIEVLKDGASAIYGADAIGGVINIITRKDFQGVEISGQKQTTARTGGDVEQSSITIGINGEKGNLVMGASYFTRDIIFARDSLYNTPGASFFSNNLIILRDANRDGVFDPTDAASGDEYVYAAVPGGCPNTDPAYYITPSGLCGYDFTLVSADEAGTANQGLFAKGTYEISDTWGVTVNASINRAKSFGRYAPPLNDTALTIPADNPFYQNEDIVPLFGANNGQVGIPDEELYATYLYHRFASIGTRDTSTDANVYDISGVFSGSLFGFADATIGARYNEYKYYEFGRFFLLRPTAQAGLDDGSYDFRDPNATPDAAAAFKATTARESTWVTREAFADVQRSMFALPGGDARLLLGWEYREEDYSDLYDAASEAGQIGGSAGNSSGLERRVRAYFGEALFPVLDNLEFTAALRYDNYSDFGTATSPKLSVRYQPIAPLTLRASWSEGFRAPTLDILSAKPAFSAESITNDQPSCEIGGYIWDATRNTCFNADGDVQSVQINATSISNPDLDAEDSTQYSVGFAYDVAKWFDFSLDYYNIKIDGVIDQFTPQEILDAIRVGDPVPSAFVITRGPTGRITDFIFGFANNGTLETSGLDLEANFRYNLGNLGNITSQLRYVYLLDYTQNNGRDLVGDPGIPDTRAQGTTEWKISDFSVGWNFNIIGDQAETVDSNGERTGKTPTYVTHDFQLTYSTPWNGMLTVGAINAFDKEPDARSAGADPNGRNFNYYLYDQYGRQPYIRYTQRF